MVPIQEKEDIEARETQQRDTKQQIKVHIPAEITEYPARVYWLASSLMTYKVQVVWVLKVDMIWR